MNCPDCKTPMTKEHGVVSEERSAYTIRGRQTPMVARPATFWACWSCEHCEEVGAR